MKPYVILCAAETIDGKIASKTGFSKLSCPQDLKRLHMLRASVDAILVGANTIINDDPLLTVRLVEGKNPVRIIVDGLLRIPLSANVIIDKSAKTIIVTSNKAPKEKINKIYGMGVEVLVMGENVNVEKLMEKLYENGVRKVLLEGGGILNWYMLYHKLVDELHITITPYILGGDNAVSLVRGWGFNNLDDCIKAKLIDCKICDCGGEVVLIYRVMY